MQVRYGSFSVSVFRCILGYKTLFYFNLTRNGATEKALIKCFQHLRLGTQELLNYLRTRQFVGTDKLVRQYIDVHLTQEGVILLTLLLIKKKQANCRLVLNYTG